MRTLSSHTRAPLTRLRIAQAATAIVDRDGLEALSMRRLGAELRVEGMAMLRGAGFDAQTAFNTLATITSYVIGMVQWEVGTSPFRSAGSEPFVLPADADPYLVELVPQLAAGDCDEAFEFGLDVIVRGLETRS